MKERNAGLADGLTHVIVCVDDTDDLTKETSTGAVAARIAREAGGLGGYARLGVSRHQLLLRDDVPYTSHNSAMAVDLRVPEDRVNELYEFSVRAIDTMRAGTSNPGLCVAVVPEMPDQADRGRIAALVEFGKLAKVEFCPPSDAYALAESVPWVELSELGGTGAGVVGALAGAGLRLSGEDGRFRGKWDITTMFGGAMRVSAGELAACLSDACRGPARVVDAHGADLAYDTPVMLARQVKPVLAGSALSVVCDVECGVARPREKNGAGPGARSRACESFEWDNDAEECDGTGIRSCRNCLHRRWTERGYECVREGDRAQTRVVPMAFGPGDRGRGKRSADRVLAM